jgi:hypothetical protein
MKRYAVAAGLAVLFATGCASTGTKSFTIQTVPEDAEIRVVSGYELESDEKYASPASVTVDMPEDPELIAKARVEVTRDGYKTVTVPIRTIRNEETIDLKLEKIVRKAFRYRLAYKLASASGAETMRFSDDVLAASFAIADQSIQMKVENIGRYDLRILWDQAEYTDPAGQLHRVMHTGVKFQSRNGSIPPLPVPVKTSAQVSIVPIDKIYYSQDTRSYDVRPLFTLDADNAGELKGRTFNLFVPVEINRAIVPYSFKFIITNATKEAVRR